MRSWIYRVSWLAVVLGMLLPAAAEAQLRMRAHAFAGVNEAGQATTVEAALRMLTEQAGVAFVGTVSQVRRVQGDGWATAQGVVEVDFLVERAIRGVAAGQVYTVREWGGLWSATDARYAVGSRLLMLLHAPGASGLSSPVGGADGMIPVRGGEQRVSVDAGSTGTGAAAQMVDLRWLQAKLVRTAAAGTSGSTVRGVQARVAGAAAGTTVSGETAAGAERSTGAAGASVDAVMQMVAQWSAEGNDAR